jgi:hypothetical protein
MPVLEPGDSSHIKAVLVRVILGVDWCETEGAVIDPKFRRASERDFRASSEAPGIIWFAAVTDLAIGGMHARPCLWAPPYSVILLFNADSAVPAWEQSLQAVVMPAISMK